MYKISLKATRTSWYSTFKKSESSSGSVSYTHLDVYKRQPKTIWEVEVTAQGTDAFIVDTQKSQAVKGFMYVPDVDHRQGNITHYAAYGSENGSDWQLLQEGEFSNIEANPRPQRVTFPKGKGQLRYFKPVSYTHLYCCSPMPQRRP